MARNSLTTSVSVYAETGTCSSTKITENETIADYCTRTSTKVCYIALLDADLHDSAQPKNSTPSLSTVSRKTDTNLEIPIPELHDDTSDPQAHDPSPPTTPPRWSRYLFVILPWGFSISCATK
jgi:hypothetical protein